MVFWKKNKTFIKMPRHQCDSAKKMDPNTPGFWACYAPSLFGKQLGLSSDNPW
jgi:hypothetical protein